jgi:hypothetical protein
MKIYLPFDNVDKNVLVLSEHDLGHQRNCCLTILESLASGKGWTWHPGVNMWYGSEQLLAQIAYKINEEWAQQSAISLGEERRAFNGLVKVYHQILTDLGFDIRTIIAITPDTPWWWGHQRFHQGEKSMLVRHDPEWYRQFFPKMDNTLCEWWPRFSKDKWVYGPHIGPTGDCAEYELDDKPILRPVRGMSKKEFAAHANRYHNLLGSGNKMRISDNEPIMDSLRVLHDRFHQKRLYQTHDHVS